MLTDTYTLVRSLTKLEKQYFYRSATQHEMGGKNNYLKLYQALCRRGKLNENRIRKQFSGNNLYLLKSHLQYSILKSLRNFHASASVSMRLNAMLDHIEILYNKGLFKAGQKILLHAKKLASTHEAHLAQLRLLEWEVKYLSAPHRFDQAGTMLKEAFRQEAGQLTLQAQFRECVKFRTEVIAFHNKSIILKKRDEKAHRSFEGRIKKLLSAALSNKAKWQLFNACGVYYSTIGDFASSNLYFKKNIELFRNNNDLFKEEMQQYLFSLYLQCATCYNLKKFKEGMHNLKNLRTLFESLPDFSTKKNILELYLYALMLESTFRMDTGEYQKALPTVEKLIQLMEVHINTVHTSLRSEFYYLQSIYWFFAEDLKRTLWHLNKILQDADSPKENPAHYCYARLMHVIVLAELEQFREMENLLPATRKYLKKKSQHYNVEEILLNHLAEAGKKHGRSSKKEKKSSLISTKEKLIRLVKDPEEAKALNVFDYLSWLDSKIEGQSFTSVVKEKNKKFIST